MYDFPSGKTVILQLNKPDRFFKGAVHPKIKNTYFFLLSVVLLSMWVVWCELQSFGGISLRKFVFFPSITERDVSGLVVLKAPKKTKLLPLRIIPRITVSSFMRELFSFYQKSCANHIIAQKESCIDLSKRG